MSEEELGFHLSCTVCRAPAPVAHILALTVSALGLARSQAACGSDPSRATASQHTDTWSVLQFSLHRRSIAPTFHCLRSLYSDLAWKAARRISLGTSLAHN